MHFSLARPGMLKHFEGQWTVTAVEGDPCLSVTLNCDGPKSPPRAT